MHRQIDWGRMGKENVKVDRPSAEPFEIYLADFNDKPIIRIAVYGTVEELQSHKLHFGQQQLICVDRQFYSWVGYEAWIERHGPTGLPKRER